MKEFNTFQLRIMEVEMKGIQSVEFSQEKQCITIPIEQLGIVINHLDEIYKSHNEVKE